MANPRKVVEKLKRYYPDAHCALDHESALELLVATILSAQCTDERVNIVTKVLFKAYLTAADYANADLPALEKIVKSTGFFRAKSRSLKGMGEALVKNHEGEVPQTLKELIRLPGVGRKTANVVLGNAFHITSGIVVDTHVKRLSFRLGWTKSIKPEVIEKDLTKKIAKGDWIMISHLLIFHGRQICKARKPACERCFLEGDCPQRGVKR